MTKLKTSQQKKKLDGRYDTIETACFVNLKGGQINESVCHKIPSAIDFKNIPMNLSSSRDQCALASVVEDEDHKHQFVSVLDKKFTHINGTKAEKGHLKQNGHSKRNSGSSNKTWMLQKYLGVEDDAKEISSQLQPRDIVESAVRITVPTLKLTKEGDLGQGTALPSSTAQTTPADSLSRHINLKEIVKSPLLKNSQLSNRSGASQPEHDATFSHVQLKNSVIQQKHGDHRHESIQMAGIPKRQSEARHNAQFKQHIALSGHTDPITTTDGDRTRPEITRQESNFCSLSSFLLTSASKHQTRYLNHSSSFENIEAF